MLEAGLSLQFSSFNIILIYYKFGLFFFGSFGVPPFTNL